MTVGRREVGQIQLDVFTHCRRCCSCQSVHVAESIFSQCRCDAYAEKQTVERAPCSMGGVTTSWLGRLLYVRDQRSQYDYNKWRYERCLRIVSKQSFRQLYGYRVFGSVSNMWPCCTVVTLHAKSCPTIVDDLEWPLKVIWVNFYSYTTFRV